MDNEAAAANCGGGGKGLRVALPCRYYTDDDDEDYDDHDDDDHHHHLDYFTNS